MGTKGIKPPYPLSPYSTELETICTFFISAALYNSWVQISPGFPFTSQFSYYSGIHANSHILFHFRYVPSIPEEDQILTEKIEASDLIYLQK